MYIQGKSTEEVFEFFRKEKGLTEQGGLYVCGVKHTKDPSLFEKAFQVFQELVEDHHITLIISCTNPLILRRAPLSLEFYDYILISIVCPSVAFHLLEHFFGTAPEENMFGTVPKKIWEWMKQVAGALYGKPILFKVFLHSLQEFCRSSELFPYMADIVKVAWESSINLCSESQKIQGRKMVLKLYKLLCNAPTMKWITAQVVEIPSSEKLIQIGNILNDLGWAYFIPLPNAMRIYLPFPFAAPLTWVKEIELLNSMRGNTLEMCSSLMLPSSLLLMAIFASTPFRPHPDLRQGFVSFDTLKEQGHGWEWMFLTAIGCCKCDINTSGKAERTYFFIPGVKREEYRDNPEIPSRAIDCIQVATTTNLAELVKQCLEFFEAGLFQNEDGIYTFLAATELELTPTLKAFIESKIKVDPTKKYWKQFQIISGPELWNLSPNVFFHHI